MKESIRCITRRIDMDVMKLVNSRHKVLKSERNTEVEVILFGPKGTLYENGFWRIILTIPDKYPYKSPSVGFVNKIYHPNVDESSGSVCLNVISQTWTALYDLNMIFDTFLPQLLAYPNPNDPLNHEAASLYIESPEIYRKRVSQYILRYASDTAIGLYELAFYPLKEPPEKSEDEESLSSISCVSEGELDDF